MNRRASMLLAGLSACLGTLVSEAGCRSTILNNSPPKLDISLSYDGGVIATFDALLDGGLSFGNVPVLTPVLQTLTLTNLGTGSLDITTISISSDGGVFSVPGTLPTGVGGGSSTPLGVQFEATEQATFTGALVITSGDPTDPTVTIPLSGTGSTVAILDAGPNPLDFGSVGQGQTQIARLRLSSVGTATLLITSLGFGPTLDPSITLASSGSLPDGGELLDAGDSQFLTFSFTPTATTPPVATGTFLIESNDPTQQPAIIQLQGETILAPVAVISGDAAVAQGQTTILDGGGSYDPNNPSLVPLTYQWEIASKPEDSTLSLTPSETVNPTLEVTLDAVGHYKFGLQVTNTASVPSNETYFDIYARPTDDLYIEMIWTPQSPSSLPSPIDMDLNLVVDGGALGDAGDCNAYDPDAGFGCVPGSDHLLGPGPEWIGIPIPPDGDYEVYCEFSDAKNATSLDTIVTLRVYVYGVLASQLCQHMNYVSEKWNAVTIAWPSGTVTPIGNTIACPESN